LQEEDGLVKNFVKEVLEDSVHIENSVKQDVEKDVAHIKFIEVEEDLDLNVNGLVVQEDKLSKLNVQLKRMEEKYIKDNVVHGDVFVNVVHVDVQENHVNGLVEKLTFIIKENVKELQFQIMHIKHVVVFLLKNIIDIQNYSNLLKDVIIKMIQNQQKDQLNVFGKNYQNIKEEDFVLHMKLFVEDINVENQKLFQKDLLDILYLL